MKLTPQDRIDIVIGRRPEFHGEAQAKLAHNDWCAVVGGGTCDCIPDIELSFRGERFNVDALGNLTTVSTH